MLTLTCRVLPVLVAVVGLTFPVCAQGQSPTTPQDRPTVGTTDTDTGAMTPRGTAGITGSTSRSSTPATRALSRQNSQNQRANNPQQPRSRVSQAARDALLGGQGGTQQRSRGGGSAGGAAASVVSGGKAGGGGTTLTAPKASAVTATGGGKAFEPALQRKVTYGKIPDGGEVLTLEGPMAANDFLQTISMATGWNILWSEAVEKVQLKFLITDKTPKEALKILEFHEIHYDFEPESKFLYVRTNEEWLREQYGDTEEAQFQIEHVDVKYIETALTNLLSSEGRIMSDERTKRIYVWDMKDNIEYMAETIADLDTPLKKETFRIQYAELADIEGVVSTLVSENGSLLSDVRTGQLVVWDVPNRLEQMSEAVRWLDVPVESRTFQVQHINAEDLVDVLSEMMTERGMIQVDPRFNTLVVTDLPQRIARMEETITALDRELETRTWVIDYADLDFVYDQIDMLVPEQMGSIVVNDPVHQITVTALPERLDKIEKLIGTWDIKRDQVLIEAFIVELSDEVERELSVNWSYFDAIDGNPFTMIGGSGFNTEAGGNVTAGQMPWAVPRYGELTLDENGNITRLPLTNTEGNPVIDHYGGKNLAVMLNYLDQENMATILSSPKVTVQDGEEAVFESAKNVPFVSSTTFFDSTRNTNTSSYVNRNTNRIEFIDVGTILTVWPRVTTQGDILLDISAEDSTFVDKVIVANDQQSTVPEKTVRHASTQLRVKTGETIVLGGLRRDRAAETTSRIPILGDLPGVGRIFRYPNRQSANTSLMIFITTTIVDEGTHPEAQMLMDAEEGIAAEHRHNKKNLWGRLATRISMGANEIGVSIGQSGALYSEGDQVSIDELREAVAQVGIPSAVTLVIRKHPRAPEAVVVSVMEAALEVGMKVEFDEGLGAPVIAPLP